jgi:plastocyanin
MSRKYLLIMATCCLVIFGLAACGGNETTSNTTCPNTSATFTQDGTINVQDNCFDPKEVKVPANVAVKVTFVNKGKTVHIVEIKGLTSEETLQPGESKSFTLTAKEQTYKMYDEIYEGQGMTGTYQGVKQ